MKCTGQTFFNILTVYFSTILRVAENSTNHFDFIFHSDPVWPILKVTMRSKRKRLTLFSSRIPMHFNAGHFLKITYNFIERFIAKLSLNFNLNLTWLRLALFLTSPHHPPTQPPNHPPSHP